MNYNRLQADFLLILSGIVATAGLRVLMAPYPNIEPVMVATLVAAIAFGPIAGFFMGAGSMILSNVFLMGSPLEFPWIFAMPLVTVYTSLAYGLVGVFGGLAAMFKKNWSRTDYAVSAGVLTLFYDLVTAIFFALQFFGPAGIMGSLVAQVPFTVLHLSNVVFAFIFTPYALKAVLGVREISLKGFPAVLRVN